MQCWDIIYVGLSQRHEDVSRGKQEAWFLPLPVRGILVSSAAVHIRGVSDGCGRF